MAEWSMATVLKTVRGASLSWVRIPLPPPFLRSMDILFKSLASAVVTAAVLMLARIAGPKLAGAIGGIPIVFAISYVLITMENRGLSNEFLVGGIYGAIAAIFFSLILILFNNKLPNHHWANFAVAYALCFLIAFGIVHLTSK